MKKIILPILTLLFSIFIPAQIKKQTVQKKNITTVKTPSVKIIKVNSIPKFEGGIDGFANKIYKDAMNELDEVEIDNNTASYRGFSIVGIKIDKEGFVTIKENVQNSCKDCFELIKKVITKNSYYVTTAKRKGIPEDFYVVLPPIKFGKEVNLNFNSNTTAVYDAQDTFSKDYENGKISGGDFENLFKQFNSYVINQKLGLSIDKKSKFKEENILLDQSLSMFEQNRLDTNEPDTNLTYEEYITAIEKSGYTILYEDSVQLQRNESKNFIYSHLQNSEFMIYLFTLDKKQVKEFSCYATNAKTGEQFDFESNPNYFIKFTKINSEEDVKFNINVTYLNANMIEAMFSKATFYLVVAKKTM